MFSGAGAVCETLSRPGALVVVCASEALGPEALVSTVGAACWEAPRVSEGGDITGGVDQQGDDGGLLFLVGGTGHGGSGETDQGGQRESLDRQ